MRRTLAVACVLAAVFAPLAHAHARLVRSVPADGAAVARSPGEVQLLYDDDVSVGPGNEVVRNGDGSALAGAPRTNGRRLVLPLRAGLAEGDYSVRWSVISNDGHVVQGVLAFAVGRGQAAPQSSLRPVARSRTLDSIERWLFLLGVLAASGAAIFRYAAFGPAARELAEPERGRALRKGSRVISGILLAACALCIAGAVPLARAANGSATRFGLVLELAAAVALLGAVLAALALRMPRLLPAASLVTVALLPLPSLSGHALDPGQPFYAPVADVLHVLAASIWLGGLLALAAVLTFLRGGAPERAGRRFSTIALAAVLVVAATGLVRAVTELAAFHQIWTTTYGRILLVKSALLLALVALGFANRRRLRLPVVLAELVLLAALVLAAAVLTGSRPGVRQPTAAVPPAAAGPIALPPRDALALAAENGRDAVTIGARFTRGTTEVTAAVLGPNGLGANGLPMRVNGLSAIACGQGCYRAIVPGRPLAVRVDFGTGTIVFPLRTVPGPAAALVASAGRLLRASTSTIYRDRLSSGPGQTLRTLWKEQAPDRLSYVIDGGAAGIVIGNRRWDREAPGGRWVASPQSPLQLPAVPWSPKVTNFHVLAADSTGWTVAFLDRATPAWFRVRIDRSTGRLASFRMTAAAHFMHDEYLSYDKKFEIRPPH
jgi:copper transport protein